MATLIIPTFHGLTYATAAAAPSTTTTSLRRVDVTPRTRTRSAVIKIIQARSSSSAGRGIADPLVTSHARDVRILNRPAIISDRVLDLSSFSQT